MQAVMAVQEWPGKLRVGNRGLPTGWNTEKRGTIKV
jgi:hypothetical protein